jgi:3-dehydroquinate synthase
MASPLRAPTEGGSEIIVNLGDRSYRIAIGTGSLRSVGPRLVQLGVGRRVALISDRNLLERYGAAVLESLQSVGLAMTQIDVPEGEAAKRLPVAEHCWEQCLDAGLDRSSTIVALGGGAVGDLAGFVAATYMRGLSFVQLPTTLLAQVDASIGGKTAIDHPRAKNLIGAIHQPRLVVIDPELLLTLPDREYRSGLAEVVKHGIALDADYFDDVEANVEKLLLRDLATLERIITGSCRLKARVVEADEREGGLRTLLNYGHTVGHALEAVTDYARWLHGEAVSLGMVAAGRLARRLGVAAHDAVDRQIRLLRAIGLPVTFDGPAPEVILRAMGSDKKVRDGKVPFILSPRIGEARLAFDVPAEAVLETLKELQQSRPVLG